MPEEKRGLEGLKAASSLCGQIITLSTGIVTLTITFVDKFRPAASPQPSGGAAVAPLIASGPLLAAWMLFFFAIVFALVTLMAITGKLHELDSNPRANVGAADREVTKPAMAMVFAFGGAMVAVIIAGSVLFL
jgi:hypothetical protein